ncbi:MAG: SDR family NAD(P)-dependent oxidoreductase [Actinobacteria bacterium]|nr:SDR family NAD(P)-dependent oxidoreductase [Actinomycetota bacterium]
MSNRNSRFERKVTIVTGGAGGLGQAITAALVEEGALVAIFDTNPDAIDRALDELARPDSVMGAIVDVRSRESVTSGVAEVVAAFGGIDILIAAAGGSLGTPRDIDDIEPEHLDLVIDVNIKGTFNCAQAVVPFMKVRGGGAIVNFSSIGGRSTSPVTGIPYAAAKAGVLGLTRRLAREVGPDGIRVNAIAPGLFLTGRLQGMFDTMADKDRNEVLDSIPLHRMPELRECVEPVLFLASEESSYITGAVLDVNGGRFMAG